MANTINYGWAYVHPTLGIGLTRGPEKSLTFQNTAPDTNGMGQASGSANLKFDSAPNPNVLELTGNLKVNGEMSCSSNLTVVGNFTVHGTNTVINSTTMQIDDHQIELAHSPAGSEGNDAAVHEGGIILKSSEDDKLITYNDNFESGAGSWKFSEHLELENGKMVYADGVKSLPSDADGLTLEATTGNVKIKATANNADIVFTVDDNGADFTTLMLDGSELGNALFTPLDGGYLDVDDTGADGNTRLMGNGAIEIVKISDTPGDAPLINFRRKRDGSPTHYPAVNDYLGRLAFYGYDSTPDYASSAEIAIKADGAHGDSATDAPGRIEFYTTANGSETPAIRMVIKNDGRVGINTESPSSTHFLDVDGGIRCTALTLGNADLNETELEILDGATITTTELNIIDGNATIGTTAVADGHGIVMNHAGTMAQTTVQTLAAYLDDEITAMPNLTSVGTLGSLTVTAGVNAASLTGTLATAAQPNITSVGSLSSLSVAGNITSDGLTVDTNTLVVDAGPNRVGIGMLSPQRNLDVFGSSSPRVRVTSTTGNNPGFELALSASGNSTSSATIHFASLSRVDVAGLIRDLFVNDTARFMPGGGNNWSISSVNASTGLFTVEAPINGSQYNFSNLNSVMDNGNGEIILSQIASGSPSSKAKLQIQVMGNFGNISNGTSTNIFQVDADGSGAGSVETFNLTCNTGTGSNTTSWPATIAGSYTRKWAIINDSSGDKLKIGTDSATNMTIQQDGKVGIGTASPVQKLHIDTGNIQLTDGYQVQWGDAENAIFGSAASDYVAIKTAGVDRLTIVAAGRIGIGTANPDSSHLLDVNGAVKATGFTGNLTGNASTATSATTAGTVTTAAQPSITSVGTLSSLTVTAGVNAASLTGTLSTVAQTNITSVGTLSSLAVSGDLHVNTTTHALFVDSSENRVGIGTNSPVQPLHIKGSNAYIKLETEAGGEVWTCGVSGGEDKFMIRDDTGDDTRLVIDNAGKVGIGTASPNELLTLEGVMSLKESAKPTQTAGYGKLYAKADNKLYFLDEAGTETDITGGGGGGASNNVVTLNDSAPGSGAVAITHGSGAGQFDDNDFFLAVKTANGNTDAITLTLPDPSTREGKIYLIKDITGHADDNNINLATLGGGAIEPGSSGSTSLISGKAAVQVIALGSNWHIY